MTLVFAGMHGDAVGAEVDDHSGGIEQVGCAAATRVSQQSDLIEIDAETGFGRHDLLDIAVTGRILQ